MLTHLSSDFYDKLKSDNLKDDFFLQIIEFKKGDNETLPLVVLSNGIIKENFYINPKFSNPEKNTWEKNIYNVMKFCLVKSNKFLVIFGYKLFLTYNEILGSPVSISEYIKLNFKNIEGSNMLPEGLIKDCNNKIKKNNNNDNFTFIKLLTQNDNKILMRVRCIQKTQIKEFYKKDGRYFSCDLIDESGIIKGSFFNDITDIFYNQIHEGKTYKIYNIDLRFSRYNQKLEVYFNKNSKIEPINDDGDIPKYNFNFKKLINIFDENKQNYIDVICIILKIGEVFKVSLKNGNEKSKRKLLIIDDTEKLVELVVWGDYAENLNFNIGDIIIFTKTKIAEFNGFKHLVLDFKSLIINKIPKLEIYKELIKWGKLKFNDFKHLNFENVKEYEVKNGFKTVEDVINESKELKGKDFKFFNCLAYVSQIGEYFYYLSCTQENCKKKVKTTDDKHKCEKCNMDIWNPKPRFISSFRISDSNLFLYAASLVDSINKIIFGKTVEEWITMKEHSEEKFKEYIDSRNYRQYKILIKSEYNNYNDVGKIKYSISKIIELNSGYSKILFDTIKITLNELK